MKLYNIYKTISPLIMFSNFKIAIYYLVSFLNFLRLKIKNIKLVCLFIIFSSPFFVSHAQTYPVQLSAQLSPPYSGYLPDYADPNAQNLKLFLQFNDFSVSQYNLKLKFEIKGNGFSLITKSIFNPPPINLQPGQPVLLNGTDLAPYLNTNNLDFIGINQSQYEQRMALPEGYYSVCVKAYDYYSGNPIQVSNEACAQAWFTLSNPPLLNTPFCNTVINPLNPQNIVFNWTPVNLGSPNSGLNTEYKFELWELRPDSTVNPNQVVQNTQPIYSSITNINSLNYGITEPPLNLYYKYAWRVKATDNTGRDWFINNGYSQVCTFFYGSLNNTLGNALNINLQAEALDYVTGKCTWTTQAIYNNYQLEIRKAGTPNWFPYMNSGNSLQIDNLQANSTYECRLKGFGNNNLESNYSNIAQFTTPNTPSYNCGQVPNTFSNNATPLPLNKAITGMLLRSGQFDIRIKVIEPADAPGWYKGTGYAMMFGAVPIPVKFSHIFIDDKQRHQQGIIEAVTQGIENWMHQFDIEDAEDDATYVNGTLNNVTINGNQYCYTTLQNTVAVCATFNPNQPIVVIRDGEGNQYTINSQPPPGTVTGPTNYLNTSTDNLAANDNLKVEFKNAANQTYGFDEKQYSGFIENYEAIKLSNGKNYFVPNKSIGENATDKALASYTISSFTPSLMVFKTEAGSVLQATKASNANTYTVNNIPAGANCVYAWYNNQKIGKLNIISLKAIAKKLIIVPVNNANISVSAQALNDIFKQANTNFSLTTAQNFTFNLGNDGLEQADAKLLSKYSAEMRALRDAYKNANTNYDKNAYYIFVVPNFSNPQLQGYMVRGRALGFVKANSTAKELAHELAHGAFGLEHSFPTITESSSNNLMDYNSGTQLVKEQWITIQNPKSINSWNDTEEDGSEIAGLGRKVCKVTNSIAGLIDYNKFLPYKFSDGRTSYIKLTANQKVKTLYITLNRAYIRSIEETKNNTTKIYVDADDASVVVYANQQNTNQTNSNVTFVNINDVNDALGEFTVNASPAINSIQDFTTSLEGGNNFGFINPSNNQKIICDCNNTDSNANTIACNNYFHEANSPVGVPITNFINQLQTSVNSHIPISNSDYNNISFDNSYFNPDVDFPIGEGNANIETLNHKFAFLEASTGYKIFTKFLKIGCDASESELNLVAKSVFANITGSKNKVVYLLVVKNKNADTYHVGKAFGSSVKDSSVIQNYIGNFEMDNNGLPNNKIVSFFDGLYKRIPKKKLIYRTFIEKGIESEYNTWYNNIQNPNASTTLNAYTKRLIKTSIFVENQQGNAIELEYYLVENLFSSPQVKSIQNYLYELKEEFIEEDAEKLALNLIANSPNIFKWGLKYIRLTGTIHSSGYQVEDVLVPIIRRCHKVYNPNCNIETVNFIFTTAQFAGMVITNPVYLFAYEVSLLSAQSVYAVMTNQPELLDDALLQFGLSQAPLLLIKAAQPVLKTASNVILIKLPQPIKNYIAAVKFKAVIKQADISNINTIIEAQGPTYAKYLCKTPNNSVYLLKGNDGKLVVGRLIKENGADAIEIIGKNENVLLDVENASNNQIDNLISDAESAVNTAGSALVNALSPALKRIHNKLVAGGVQIFEQGNVIKYVTKNSNEFAKIEDGVFSVSFTRPNIPVPSTYLDATYITNHINKFKQEGAGFIVVKSWIEGGNPLNVTLPSRKFVGLRSEIDAVIAKYKEQDNDWTVLRDELNLGPNTNLAAEEIYYIKIDGNDPRFNFDVPSGNEYGAITGEWVPGGYTKNGIAEAALIGADNITHNKSITQLINNFSNNWEKIK